MKTKTYILTVSKNFLKGHPREGQHTDFKEKILAGQKIHTIRENYQYWKKVEAAVNSGAAVLSVRQWVGKPYNSPQVEIKQLNKIYVQEVKIMPEISYYKASGNGNSWNSYFNDTYFKTLAENDGLMLPDFKAWFSFLPIFCGGIIHFTDFRY